jgi:hypothetical protein
LRKGIYHWPVSYVAFCLLLKGCQIKASEQAAHEIKRWPSKTIVIKPIDCRVLATIFVTIQLIFFVVPAKAGIQRISKAF